MCTCVFVYVCMCVCGGDGSSCAISTINISYNTITDIAGFQFSHNGCVTGASGGAAAAAGFTVSASGSAVLGFSFTGSVVPAGEGTLVTLSGDIVSGCLSNFIFSDSSGNPLNIGFDNGNNGDDGGDDGGSGDCDEDVCLGFNGNGGLLYSSSAEGPIVMADKQKL